jgi:hypothetical protein
MLLPKKEAHMKIYFTRGINDTVAENEVFAKQIVEFIKKYCKRDWGDLCALDKKQNAYAITHGGRVLAAYQSIKGKVYIITDDTTAKEKITTVLFASEY